MATTKPLPSLIRASSWDAGNFSMRDAGRKKWSRDDFNAAAETQNRLIRACYGRKEDAQDAPDCFLRFQIAEGMERAGLFDLRTSMKVVNAFIDHQMGA